MLIVKIIGKMADVKKILKAKNATLAELKAKLS
jgi:hypothetical protein